MDRRADARAGRRYWVWVARPEFYLDEDGADRRSLEPGLGYEPGGWWTCHRETEDGDLVLLYRSRLKKDLAYLIEARSAAYSILDDEGAAEYGWDYGCDYDVLEKFGDPLTLGKMKADPALGDWGALRAGFRRRVYEIPPDTWNHLMDRLVGVGSRTRIDRIRRTADKRYALERDIEDRLAANMGLFRPFGYNLELRDRQHVCRRGGRADLVSFDVGAKRYVVIELKRGLVGRDAVAQLLSCASIAEEYPNRSRPRGILIGDRLDNEALGMVNYDERLEFVPLADLN